MQYLIKTYRELMVVAISISSPCVNMLQRFIESLEETAVSIDAAFAVKNKKIDDMQAIFEAQEVQELRYQAARPSLAEVDIERKNILRKQVVLLSGKADGMERQVDALEKQLSLLADRVDEVEQIVNLSGIVKKITVN